MAASGSRCFYELLGVERSASAEEIRAAYRKKALKLHPDKWCSSSEISHEEATARFQELVKAYEVLSDPNERAWYDSHRTQILFSSAASASASGKSQSAFDLEINLWPYFSPSAYSGYGDTGKGFYKVYGDLFQSLFQSEIAYANAVDESLAYSVHEPPVIGVLGSDYEQAEAFYDYWLGFSTIKGFEWLGEHVPNSAMADRRTRRLVDEANRKLRRKARKDFNETVRQLALFVKKRDKRVLQKQLERKKEANAKAQQAKIRTKELHRQRQQRAKEYVEQDWAKAPEEEQKDDWFEEENLPAEDSAEFYCVICSKKFKSEKQWKNHEQSKKHKQRVADLRDTLLQEDELDEKFREIDLDEGVQEAKVSKDENLDFHRKVDSDEGVQSRVSETETLDLQPESSADDHLDIAEAETVKKDEALSADDEASFLESMLERHRTRNGVKRASRDAERMKLEQPEGNGGHDSELRDSFATDDFQEKHEIQQQASSTETTDCFESEDEQREKSTNVANRNVDTVSSQKPDTTRAKQKPSKMSANGSSMARNSISNTKSQGKKKKGKAVDKHSSNMCEVCGRNFDSRNQLFSHISKEGHAVLKGR